MASKNAVVLTFAGDATDLEKTFDKVGSSAEGMSSRVDDSTRGFDRLGGGIDNTGQKAGDLESGFRGVTDSMAGMGKIAQGDVLGGLTDLAGAGEALAFGFAGVVVPALQKTVGWLAKTRVGMAAMALWSGIVSVATKVWAGVQAVFNAVMALNPVVLITLAIIALIAVVVIAYQRSETFRKIVQGAFRAVGAVVSWLGDRFAQWWAGVRAIFNRVSDVVGGVVGTIRRRFGALFSAITSPFRSAFNFVARAWNNTIGRLSWTFPSIFGVGGFTINAPDLPTFHRGGRVPGAPGSETLAVLQAGEQVTPAGRSGAMVLTVASGAGGRTADQALAEIVLHLVRTGALALRVREGAVVV